MTKTPAVRGLLAGFVLLTGSVTAALAQGGNAPKRTPPTPAQMLDARLAPKHDDVTISTPTADELAGCTVQQVVGQTPGSSGWLLLDAKKQPLRRFFATTGANVDMWSYFRDGVEVYREFDTAGKGAPNNFRWLNAGGMKWGVGAVDARGKAVISGWRMISAEEASFEAYQAVARQDFARLHVLFATEAEMQALKLPSTKIKTTIANQQQAQKKFADLIKTVNLGAAKFDDIENAVPQCDTTGDVETIKFPNRSIRYVAGREERKWIHTGEILQVGMGSWKLVDVPSDKDPVTPDPNPPKNPQNPELQKFLELLTQLDTNIPPSPAVGGNCAKTDKYLRDRIAVVQKVIPLDKADQREGWYKQLFDNLMAMAQNKCDEASLALLKKLSDDVATQMPGSSLAGYGVYRYHWSTYAAETFRSGTDTKKITEAQDKFLGSLGDFVKKYTSAEDTPEALYQLGSGCEFGGKVEEAKRWYGQLATSFKDHHLAQRSKGCVARLSLVGNRMELTAPLLHDAGKVFDISQLKSKVVIVHYWSSQSEQYDTDFNRLKRLLADVGTKQNVELVCISLDDTATRAKEAVAKVGAPGIHLYQAPSNNAGGGQNSALATQYGIHILPTIFMVGRDGRVTNNSLQISDIETELKKVQ